MFWNRMGLAAILSATVGGALWLLMKPAAPAQAAETGSTPGQLTILDKNGNEAGVCPLKQTDVQADIAGYVSRVTVRQQFTNPTRTPVEAVYTFPLPADAAVDDMTMQIGRRVIKGQIMRREEARVVYETAKQEGKAAALLDQERPNIFTQSVANIMPGENITITISYVNLLKYNEGVYEFSFPMVVGPRFNAQGGYTKPGERGSPSPTKQVLDDPGNRSVVTDPEKITPPITPPGTRAGHNISLTVNLDAGIPLQKLESALHPVNVQRRGSNRAVVRLRNRREIPNKDFILRYTAAGSQMQSGMLVYGPGGSANAGGYFTLILQPPMAPTNADIAPKEMVFVLDQTGSQQGLPIQKSKETMRYCIQNMNPGDTFQLIGFNTEVYPCFPQAVPNTPENVQKALKFIEPLEGSGGTDILKSVDYALKMPDDPKRLRIICYMTDGFVGNDMQIINYIRKNRGRARMFPFGIGNGVNRFLIEGMAREGMGAAEIVDLNMPGEAAASRFYRRVSQPLLLSPEIDWKGMPVADVYPKAIPDVFSAGPIIVKGRYTRPGAGRITVRGMLRGQWWSQTLDVVFPANKSDGSAIATLWAREKIEDLQSQDWLGAQTGNPKPEITEQIIATALEYRLMSQYTSFVAVEQRVVNVGGKQRKMDVPVEMTDGVSYAGIFGEDRQALSPGNAPARRQKARSLYYYSNSSIASPSGGIGGGGRGGGSYGFGAPGAPASAAPMRRTRKEKPEEESLDRRDSLKDEADAKSAMIQSKLAPALHKLTATVAREGKNGSLSKPGFPTVIRGRVEVQVWVNKMPADGLKKLKALGFELVTTVTPNRLLLGTADVKKLEAMAELEFVLRIEPPKFK
jgi:Ca-activated chloride channel family protein